jgi:hypothetical protein
MRRSPGLPIAPIHRHIRVVALGALFAVLPPIRTTGWLEYLLPDMTFAVCTAQTIWPYPF